MRKNRRDSIRKERIIMIASSALVLGALTMTGLYMKGKEIKEQNDGYTLDLAALEKKTGDTLEEIDKSQNADDVIIGGGLQPIEGELDYMPLEGDLTTEVGSGLIQIPGLTDEVMEEAPADVASMDVTSGDAPEQGEVPTATEPAKELHYSEEQGLTRPVDSEILLPYSMDGSIYFATLDQYKYNPATIFAAAEGANVLSCAEGRITSVFETAELGKGITMELGDGYVVTYGQLADIQVAEGDVVKAGETLGTVAAPSRYYSLEGTNLYFRMEKDGTPVNSELLF